jgi:hypothetical protein
MRKVYSSVLITLTVIAVIVLLLLAGLLVTKLPTTNDPIAIGTLVTGIVTAFAVAVAIVAGFYAKEQLDAANGQLAAASKQLTAANGQLEAAKEQLREGQKIAYGDFLLRLDEAFQRHQDVHIKLRFGGESPKGRLRFPKDWPAIESYMGMFERVQLLLEKDLIDIGTVNRLYGYRLFNIVVNPTIYQEKLVNLGYGWKDFIKLWKALADLDKRNPQPDVNVLKHLGS